MASLFGGRSRDERLDERFDMIVRRLDVLEFDKIPIAESKADRIIPLENAHVVTNNRMSLLTAKLASFERRFDNYINTHAVAPSSTQALQDLNVVDLVAAPGQQGQLPEASQPLLDVEEAPPVTAELAINAPMFIETPIANDGATSIARLTLLEREVEHAQTAQLKNKLT